MSEIIFWVEESPEGGYTARALGESIFTEADTFNELRCCAVSLSGRRSSQNDTPSPCKRRSHCGMRLPRDLSSDDLIKTLPLFPPTLLTKKGFCQSW